MADQLRRTGVELAGRISHAYSVVTVPGGTVNASAFLIIVADQLRRTSKLAGRVGHANSIVTVPRSTVDASTLLVIVADQLRRATSEPQLGAGGCQAYPVQASTSITVRVALAGWVTDVWSLHSKVVIDAEVSFTFSVAIAVTVKVA